MGGGSGGYEEQNRLVFFFSKSFAVCGQSGDSSPLPTSIRGQRGDVTIVSAARGLASHAPSNGGDVSDVFALLLARWGSRWRLAAPEPLHSEVSTYAASLQVECCAPSQLPNFFFFNKHRV